MNKPLIMPNVLPPPGQNAKTLNIQQLPNCTKGMCQPILPAMIYVHMNLNLKNKVSVIKITVSFYSKKNNALLCALCDHHLNISMHCQGPQPSGYPPP